MHKFWLPSDLKPLLWFFCWVMVAVKLLLYPVSTSHGGRPASAAISNIPSHSDHVWTLEAQGLVPQPPLIPAAHASNLVALPNDPRFSLAVFWFAGSKEAQPDVRIAMSLWSRQQQAWTEPVWVVDRISAGDALGKGILHIGNPVAWLDQQQRLHLFVVGTGLGGWAASRVVHLRQPSDHISPSQPQFEVIGQLPLSWLWNLSHLVRHAPLPLADGGMVLPLHFELGKHFPVFAWFSANGEFQGIQRLVNINHVLQPAVVAMNATHWLAYMRSLPPYEKVSLISSTDAGVHWSSHDELSMSNQNSAVAALLLPSYGVVMARNPLERARSLLVMHHSEDGLAWTAPQTLADGSTGSEYSYPSLSWVDDRLWISYTHLRQGIAWQRWRTEPAVKAKP